MTEVMEGCNLPIPWWLTRLAFASVPTVVAMLASINYYGDLLKCQSPTFYDPTHVDEFDFIVIGGGSAGSVVANRLSKHHRVLLLEGGGDPTPLASIPALAVYLQQLDSTDWQYRTEPQNNSHLAMKERRSLWPRGKGLGGSSNLNFMIYQRGNPQDYNQLAEATGDPEWGYEQLLPLFKKSENYHGNFHGRDEEGQRWGRKEGKGEDYYHGHSGPLQVSKLKTVYLADKFLEAGKEMGYEETDLNSEQAAGFSQIDATVNSDGKRWSTFEAFIRPIQHRGNLVIYRYSRAIKIHLSQSRHAYGVTYVRHGMVKFVRAKREIIVSAGAIDSPRLLMLSGIGPREHLHSVGLPCRVHLPGVGQNLQDHVTTLVGPFTMNAKSLLIDREVNLYTLQSLMTKGEGPLASLSGLSAVAFISSSMAKNSSWPDIGYFMSDSGVHRSLAGDFTRIFGMKQGVLHKYYGPHVGKDANFVLTMLGKPKSVGELRLGSRSPWDKPLIQPNYFSHPDDMLRMKEAVKFIVDLYEKTETYRALGAQLVNNPFPGCEQLTFKSDAYYECYIRQYTMTVYHPCGTCAMGKRVNDTAAVVDSKLRVRKVRGLRVADTSVLRVIPNANLNAPAILIGEKVAFLVRDYWAKQFEVCTTISYYFYGNQHLYCFYTSVV